MGDIKNRADDVFRDFITAGVPASEHNDPTKPEIRGLFSLIDVAVGAAQAGYTTVSTIADRNTFYAILANQGKLVYVNNNNDSATDPANGVYEYVNGGPRFAASFYQGVAAIVQPLVTQAQGYADAASSSAQGIAATADLVAKTNTIVGSPDAITRGHALVAGTFNTGAGPIRGWTTLVPEAGSLQAVNAYIGQTGNLTVSVIDPTGKVVYVQGVTATGTGVTRLPLPSPVAIAALSRVVLTEGTGRIHYQNTGSDVVLSVAGPHGIGETPTQTTVAATASFNYEVVILPSVPLAQGSSLSQADLDTLKASIRPISLKANAAGNVIATYLDGSTQNLGPIDAARLPVASAVYAADDPAPGRGSPMVFSRVANSGGIVVPAANGAGVPAYRKAHAANPCIITFNDLVFLYFRVDPGTNVQSIALWTQPIAGFDPLNAARWTDRGVVVGPASGYDGTWDPSAVVFAGKVRLYWQSHTGTGNLFTAESVDGFTFTVAVNTGVQQAGAPTVTAVGNTLYAFYGSSGVTPQGLMLRSSADGVTFGAASSSPVISSTGNAYDTDGAQIVTARFFYQAPYLYIIYGGTPQGRTGSAPLDWPEGMLLARAVAPFTSWEKHPANPVFLRGPIGAFDAAAVWSGQFFRLGGVNYLFYEAMGGSDVTSRDKSYQGFGTTAFSQIGVAKAPVDAVLSNWSPDANDLPPGVYTIQNMHSGKFLGVSSSDPSAIVCQYKAPQKWIVQRGTDGFYILSLQSAGVLGAQLLTDPNGSRVIGISPNVYPSSSTYPTPPVLTQEYKLAPQISIAAGQGIYEIINRYNSLNIEPGTPFLAEAAQIVFNPQNGLARQKWQFTKVSA